MKRPFVVTLAGAALTAATVSGCTTSAERAANPPGVAEAGRKLTSDAIAKGDASGAVPQLEAGNSAIGAFTGAAGKCPRAKS